MRRGILTLCLALGCAPQSPVCVDELTQLELWNYTDTEPDCADFSDAVRRVEDAFSAVPEVQFQLTRMNLHFHRVTLEQTLPWAHSTGASACEQRAMLLLWAAGTTWQRSAFAHECAHAVLNCTEPDGSYYSDEHPSWKERGIYAAIYRANGRTTK